jgi:H+/Cl- antiporter ClcA
VSQPEPLSGSAYLRLVALGAVIGIPAAFLAALFLAVVHDLEHWLWDSLPSALGHSAPPWYLVLLLPPAGACVVLLARTLPAQALDRRMAARQAPEAGLPVAEPG